jgi:hypothetical protein
MAFRRLFCSGTAGHHQDVVLLMFTDGSPFIAAAYVSFGEQKNPLTPGKQGMERVTFDFSPAYLQVIQIGLGVDIPLGAFG